MVFLIISILIIAVAIFVYIYIKSFNKRRLAVDTISEYTFSTVSLPTLILDNSNKIILENKAAVVFFGKSVTGKDSTSILLQNSGSPDLSLFEDNFSDKIMTAVTKSGTKTCDVLLNVNRDKPDEKVRKILVIRDITDIIHKDSLLEVVNRVAGILLEPVIPNFEKNFHEAMGIMANAVDVDRVYIWKNHAIGDNLYCSQIYEWSEGAPPLQNHELTVNVSYTDNMSGLEKHLSDGNCINGIVSEMIPEHRAHLEPQGIFSILIAPVFVDNLFWGFMGFDDCRNERVFKETEETILRTVSKMFVNALLRQDMTKELEIALTDELTGVRNRRFFMEVSKAELQMCIKENLPFNLILIDVDNFKRVNDNYGHLVGDIVLKILAERMSNCLKKDTLLARYGGEEFIVMMSIVRHEIVMKTAERIRRNIEEHPFIIGEMSLNLTISLGVASLNGQSESLSGIIDSADKALYLAKQNGKNRVETIK